MKLTITPLRLKHIYNISFVLGIIACVLLGVVNILEFLHPALMTKFLSNLQQFLMYFSLGIVCFHAGILCTLKAIE